MTISHEYNRLLCDDPKAVDDYVGANVQVCCRVIHAQTNEKVERQHKLVLSRVEAEYKEMVRKFEVKWDDAFAKLEFDHAIERENVKKKQKHEVQVQRLRANPSGLNTGVHQQTEKKRSEHKRKSAKLGDSSLVGERNFGRPERTQSLLQRQHKAHKDDMGKMEKRHEESISRLEAQYKAAKTKLEPLFIKMKREASDKHAIVVMKRRLCWYDLPLCCPEHFESCK